MHLLGVKSLVSQGLSDLLHRLQSSSRCMDVYEFGGGYSGAAEREMCCGVCVAVLGVCAGVLRPVL